MQKQSLIIDGQQIVYSVAGKPTAPPVVMLHGWLSHRGVWTETIEALQDRYYCLAPDMLGFGDSAKPAEQYLYSIPTQAEQIAAFAEALGLEHFALLGHSRGAQISLQIAAVTAPERVTKLIDVDGVVSGQRLGFYIRWLLVSITWLWRYLPIGYDILDAITRRYPRVAMFLFAPLFYDIRRVPERFWWREWFAGVRRASYLTSYLTARGMMATDLTPYLKNIKAPVLIITGKQDRILPPFHRELKLKHIPRMELALFDCCGHYPMYEKLHDYLAVIEQFLKTA